jgi:ribA/ribD-fused uncharacterized protein
MKNVKETDTHIYFWGSVLSNFSPVKMKFAGMDFHTSEQLFMYLKAKYFEDEEMAQMIATRGQDPKDAKKFGRQVTGFDISEWANARESMMQIALQRKFMDDDLFKLLLSTGDKILVEGSPYDKIWGVGLAYDSKEILNEENWDGLNLLGKVLMKVRGEIKQIISQKK